MLINYVVITTILIVGLADDFVWAKEPHLQLVNVVFRHGHRTPDIDAVYPNDPYKSCKFDPEGFGSLTNKGKRKAFDLGKLLRQKYDGFLNSTYIASNVHARSSDYDRTKMSLQLVLTGLYPPNYLQKWHDSLNWQPIPITYVSKLQEDLYLRIFECRKYYQNYMKAQKTPEVVEKLASFGDLIKTVMNSTGMELKDFFDLYVLYGHLQSQQEMGLKLPNWTHSIYPTGELLNASVTELEILNYNDALKKRNGGPFLRKISESMLAVKDGSNKETGRKIYLYSAHDISVSGLIAALNLKNTRVPEYCSAIIIELLQDDGKYFVKVLHYLGEPSKIEEMQIPNCANLCPLEDFFRLTRNVIPSDEDMKCN